MPPYLLEMIRQLGVFTPFIYAAGTYGFFHYLDKQASMPAKKAISEWLKPLEYDRAAIAAATVEIFDRLYTRPLLGWRAVLRSALFTATVTAIFTYEVFNSSDSDLQKLVLSGRQGLYSLAAAALVINIVSDYVSLFFVRKYLVLSQNRPMMAILIGPFVGMLVVIVLIPVRNFVADLSGIDLTSALIRDIAEDIRHSFEHPDQPYSYFDAESALFYAFVDLPALPALAVHLWLPLFGFGLLCLKGLNYLLSAVSGMQWFLKRGNEHPLDAVGYVLGAIVFVGTVVARLA